ncbi:hypothetical protein [Vampirovibrio sp.]|uniref:hypothetical protein n=1 Tax=Vampirovibrio sp. TaxID=2717857 RepID=UPI003593BAA6
MTHKFSHPFVEIRFYVPLDSEAWQDFQASNAFATLAQAGLVQMQEVTQHVQKGKKHA